MNNCSIVRDILPLYVEVLLSEETKTFVDEHILTCGECKRELELAQKKLSNNTHTKDDGNTVMTKVKRNLYMKRLIIACVSIFLTASVCITGMLVYQEVDFVNDYFAPNQMLFIQKTSTDWTLLQSDFCFDSINYSREVVNHVNSKDLVELRILDSNDTVIIDNLAIEPGKVADLSKLKYNQEYKIYAKTQGDYFILNFI